MEETAGSCAPGMDPISRHILERTSSQRRSIAPTYSDRPLSSSRLTPDDPQQTARQNTASTDGDTMSRRDTLPGSRDIKEKKKGTSFLSRLLPKKKEEEPTESLSGPEYLDGRDEGAEAEVFTQPLGFIPNFPAPPRYIRVKAQNRRRRDFDRLFLAQILSESASRARKGSEEIDSKIRGINERPALQTRNSTRVVENAIWAAEFSKDGQYLAVGGSDKRIRVWHVISSREDRSQESGADTQDGSENVRLNAPVFKQALAREYEGHTATILDLSWSKNNFLLSSSADRTVRLYHISRPECLCSFKHTDFVTSIAFHPRDDRFFLAGSLDQKLRLWSIPDKNVAYWVQAPDMVTAVGFTPDGRTSIAGTSAGQCLLYETSGLTAHSQIHVRSNRGKNSRGSKITGIETISIDRTSGQPDLKLLITSNDSRIRMYNLRDRSLEVKFRGHKNTESQIRASFSDDGKYIICGSEDKRVYIWPTGAVESTDPEKRPIESFEACSSMVTTAIFAPTSTRRVLAQSGDPIYDLCNPPPVKLLSRVDSGLSSKAPTQHSGSEVAENVETKNGASSIDENPKYVARLAHSSGHAIVSGDWTGSIKVFRQDCAYQKRHDSNWDSGSFTKKILGRSGSVATGNSGNSSAYRRSILSSDNDVSNAQIRDWQNSVLSAKTPQITSARDTGNHHHSLQEMPDRRSISPQKSSFMKRFSLRHGSIPLANSTPPSSDSQRIQIPPQQPAEDSVQSPEYRDALLQRQRTNSIHQSVPSIQVQEATSPTAQFAAATVNGKPAEYTAHPNLTHTENPFGDKQVAREEAKDADTGLFLIGEQSYMAWDVRGTYAPMAHAAPRSPGPSSLNVQNPLSRGVSYVSQLSDERGSLSRSTSSAMVTPLEERRASLGGQGQEDGDNSAEELKCHKCGNESFSRSKHGRKLKCRRCGQEV